MKIVILGGGISGLTAAWKLQHRADVTVIEKANRFGGWIRTVHQDGFLFECGPRSFRTGKDSESILQLIDELGLTSDLLVASPEAKKRYVWYQNQLLEAPSSLWQAIKSPLTRDLLGAILREPFKKNACDEDESIYQFVSRRFSSTLAERLVDPLVSCIYGGDIKALSVQACFPSLKKWERDKGSVVWGAICQGGRSASLATLRNGMESLVSALTGQLQANLLLNSEVVGIERKSTGAANTVFLADGRSLKADRIVCTLPPHALGTIVDYPVIPAASMAVVNLGWDSQVLNFKGFGNVIPTSEDDTVLGIVWDSSAFPEQNPLSHQTRLTVMMGGARSPNICSYSDKILLEKSIQTINNQLHISKPPTTYNIFRAGKAIPLYPVGHGKIMSELKKKWENSIPGLILCGSAWGDVGISPSISRAFNLKFSF